MAQRIFRGMEATVQTLHLYGAAGIVAFGWAMCRLLHCEARPWLPFWFCAALLMYNVDRLRRDPSDGLNIPKRAEAAQRLRPWSWLLVAISALTLVALPIARRDWLTLALSTGGAMVCLNYSLPVRGFRLKDVPLLKTFFAPSLVIAAVFGLPLFHGRAQATGLSLLIALWAWGILFSNMVLCDLRDIPGDRKCGVVSVPSRLGYSRTYVLLYGLAGFTGALGALIALINRRYAMLWFWLAGLNSAYVGGLIVAARKAQSERFYEWWVEGVLFVSAIVLALAARP